MTGRPMSRSNRYQQQRTSRHDEAPLGYNNNNYAASTNSSNTGDDHPIKLSTSASFDRDEYFLSSPSLNFEDDNIEGTKTALDGQPVPPHKCRRRSLSEGDGDEYYDYHMSLRDDHAYGDDDDIYNHDNNNQDDLSRAYAGLSRPYHGPLATKIALLRKKSSDIDSQLSSSNSHMTMSERRGLLDQKVEIEKTLGLMVHPAVNSVVRKRDSMDMSLLEDHGHRHRDRAMSGDYDSSNNHASHYSSSSHQKCRMGISNKGSGTASGKGEFTDSIKTFKTYNTSASSGFSAITAPASGRQPGGRRGSILGQVFRGGNATISSRVADSTRLFMRQLSGDSLHSHEEEDDDDDDSFFGVVDDGFNNANSKLAANNDDSFQVGSLGSRNDTLRASDHLFLSDEIFTSPSLRCLSITSRESLKKLKNIKPVYDDDNPKGEAKKKADENAVKSTIDHRLMTYDEYKAATRTTADPSPDSLVALSQINRRWRRAKSFDDTCTAVPNEDMKKTFSRPREGRRISCDERLPASQFAPPSEDAMEAFTRINLRKARRATMAHGSSTTNDNIGTCNDYGAKPPNMKPGQGQPSSNAQLQQSTATSKEHGRRPSIWGGLLNTLSAEVAPLPQAGPYPTNCRSSDGPCSSHSTRENSLDLRNKKGRVYSM